MTRLPLIDSSILLPYLFETKSDILGDKLRTNLKSGFMILTSSIYEIESNT